MNRQTPQWGRSDQAGRWVSRAPVASILTVLLACGVAVCAIYVYPASGLSATQRSYLPSYIGSGWLSGANVRLRYGVLRQGQWVRETWPSADFHEALRGTVYHGAKSSDIAIRVARVPIEVGGVALAAGLLLAIPVDVRRCRERRNGIRRQGSERLEDARAFNKRFSG